MNFIFNFSSVSSVHVQQGSTGAGRRSRCARRTRSASSTTSGTRAAAETATWPPARSRASRTSPSARPSRAPGRTGRRQTASSMWPRRPGGSTSPLLPSGCSSSPASSFWPSDSAGVVETRRGSGPIKSPPPPKKRWIKWENIDWKSGQ